MASPISNTWQSYNLGLCIIAKDNKTVKYHEDILPKAIATKFAEAKQDQVEFGLNMFCIKRSSDIPDLTEAPSETSALVHFIRNPKSYGASCQVQEKFQVCIDKSNQREAIIVKYLGKNSNTLMRKVAEELTKALPATQSPSTYSSAAVNPTLPIPPKEKQINAVTPTPLDSCSLVFTGVMCDEYRESIKQKSETVREVFYEFDFSIRPLMQKTQLYIKGASGETLYKSDQTPLETDASQRLLKPAGEKSNERSLVLSPDVVGKEGKILLSYNKNNHQVCIYMALN